MRKAVALLLALAFLTASCVIMTKPAFSSTDVADNTWVTKAPMHKARAGLGVAVVKGKIYAIGGITTIFPSDLSSSLYPTITTYATNEAYTPFGYGTVPPTIDVVSPRSQTYNESSVSLVFTVNKPVNWTGYSLDGGETVTVAGNTTLEGLANGLHNVTVYAKDAFGNVGASETVSFTVAVPFPATMVITPIALVAVVSVGFIVYFRKRKR
jgi:hypothetical protein